MGNILVVFLSVNDVCTDTESELLCTDILVIIYAHCLNMFDYCGYVVCLPYDSLTMEVCKTVALLSETVLVRPRIMLIMCHMRGHMLM
jgi:hypothetical protein